MRLYARVRLSRLNLDRLVASRARVRTRLLTMRHLSRLFVKRLNRLRSCNSGLVFLAERLSKSDSIIA